MLLNTEKLYTLFEILDKTIINPVTELKYTNNFTLLIAVVLSAQAKDSSVNIATEQLFKIVQTPEDIVNLGEEKLIEHIKSIGLYKTKAKNIILLSEKLIEQHNSEVPNDFEKLINLNGVGRKTANVILNCAFNKPTMPVDTHVYRVSRRMGITKANTVEKVEEDLLNKIPEQFLFKAHHLLILHGRYTCKAKGYDCNICKVKEICTFDNKLFKTKLLPRI